MIEPEVEPRKVSESDIDTEFFEVGAFAGLLSIDNFSTEPVVGLSASFHATEDFFVQFNYGFASAGLTSFEELSGQEVRLLTDDERDYQFYDLLVGYNVFPGEVFMTRNLTFNSAIYIEAGVGNTNFAGEDNFTLVWGTGYRIILQDWLTCNINFRDHMFRSDVIRENQMTHNIEMSLGVSVFF
ncbi:MAG: outer membrane beta-barrel domain-containing protein [Ketobacteraceae bacterium]|nr:outer membrane beta-barrel domain-containing protein [Ketobacteraceae bacterium]